MRKAFTTVELLVVIAVISILAVVVILTLNPAQLFKESRDTQRVSDLSILGIDIQRYASAGSGSLGTSSIVYLSVPDLTATTSAGTNCAGLGFPSANTAYHCPASSTYRNSNGTGWIPINFTAIPGGSPLGTLPVDPINMTSSPCQYYEYTTNGTSFEVEGEPESQKYASDSAVFATGPSQSLLGTFCVTYATSTYATDGGLQPRGIAFDSHTNTVWVANASSSNIMAINDSTYATATIALPVGVAPWGVAFDSHTNTVWVAFTNADGVMQINDTTYATSTYGISYTGPLPVAIAFDPNNNSLWVANNDGATVTQINDTTLATTSVAVGVGPLAVVFDPHTDSIWVANVSSSNITVINDTTYAINATISVTSPYGMAFDPHTDSMWVPSFSAVQSVTQMNDLSYGSTSYYVSGGGAPAEMAFDSNNNSLWVTNWNTGTVTEFLPNR